MLSPAMYVTDGSTESAIQEGVNSLIILHLKSREDYFKARK
ncbi:hypothetical protein MAR_005595 [Mya arenaria]|uniref:Uncharacterized protein n=1 Tax=Mya arenaria TaxID=6604 RepID=A0ABY7F1F6_MYAAR|nr:hypothetical protein MAR_005595 [Mya arenaria]